MEVTPEHGSSNLSFWWWLSWCFLRPTIRPITPSSCAYLCLTFVVLIQQRVEDLKPIQSTGVKTTPFFRCLVRICPHSSGYSTLPGLAHYVAFSIPCDWLERCLHILKSHLSTISCMCSIPYVNLMFQKTFPVLLYHPSFCLWLTALNISPSHFSISAIRVFSCSAEA